MKLFKSNLFIALCITLTISLIFAWSQRWDYGSKHSVNDSDTYLKASYKKDKWTGQNWLILDGVDGDEKHYLSQSTVPDKDNEPIAWIIRDSLTFLWSLLTFLSLLFSIYGLLGKLRD
jgi:hypothetical protein